MLGQYFDTSNCQNRRRPQEHRKPQGSDCQVFVDEVLKRLAIWEHGGERQDDRPPQDKGVPVLQLWQSEESSTVPEENR